MKKLFKKQTSVERIYTMYTTKIETSTTIHANGVIRNLK